MIQEISIGPHQIKEYTIVCIEGLEGLEGLEGFPFLSIDNESYIVKAEIQTGLDFDICSNCHSILIGKGCSLADDITLMIDLNHDYYSVLQGVWEFMGKSQGESKIKRKGTVIIQNDVWVGHGATIMSGVTLHNGCIVAANAVVTKDVPPYAIVGGNPARIIKYRFDEEIIDGLQKIACWDWPETIKINRKEDFKLDPKDFVKKYYSEAEQKMDQKVKYVNETGRKVILLYPDVNQKFPLYKEFMKNFFKKDREQYELLIYVSKRETTEETITQIEDELKRYDRNCYVTLQTGEDIDEHSLFDYADYYVTTRHPSTVRNTCLCDLHEVKVLYGTDEILIE